jgi:hypothetical protein
MSGAAASSASGPLGSEDGQSTDPDEMSSVARDEGRVVLHADPGLHRIANVDRRAGAPERSQDLAGADARRAVQRQARRRQQGVDRPGIARRFAAPVRRISATPDPAA